MEDKRKLELYEKALDWITENSTSRADLYDTLSEGLGMSDDEIIEVQFSTLTDFMDNEFDLQISAFVQSGGNCLVIPLPTNRYNLGTKLGSIGLGFNDPLLITDDSDAPVRVKLMTENSTGCHFIKLFDKNDNLMDVSNMIQRVMNSEEEIRPELRRRLVDGKYHNSEELLDDMAELTSQVGEYKKTFYFPLTGTLDDGFGSTDTVSNRYLRNFKSEIAELIEKEQSNDLNNMKDYFDEDENARQKMVSAKWGIEELNQTLYGKVDFRLRIPFTAEEQEKVRDWIEGQNSDGYVPYFHMLKRSRKVQCLSRFRLFLLNIKKRLNHRLLRNPIRVASDVQSGRLVAFSSGYALSKASRICSILILA